MFIYLHYVISPFRVRELGIPRETGTWHSDTGTSRFLFPVSSFSSSTQQTCSCILDTLAKRPQIFPVKSQCWNMVVVTLLNPACYFLPSWPILCVFPSGNISGVLYAFSLSILTAPENTTHFPPGSHTLLSVQVML